MKGIYNIRTLFEKYYSEYGNYIDAAAKFVTALILFMQINGRIGGKSIFGNIFVELILALVCAILPPNVMIVLAFVAALLQFASVSIASLGSRRRRFAGSTAFIFCICIETGMGHATDNPRTFLPCPVYRTDQFRADGKYDVRSRYGCGNGILLYVIDDRKAGRCIGGSCDGKTEHCGKDPCRTADNDRYVSG